MLEVINSDYIRTARAKGPLLMAYTMMLAVGVVSFQLFADILYSWLDPRIRFG
jgi:peptide/nickel transport system permease protein